MRKLLISLCFAALAVFSSPLASAHVEIVSAYPEQFANVNPIPTEVWIDFSGELQNLEGEIVNSIEVTDSTGLVVSYGDAIISSGKISTMVSGQSAAGAFIVKYRVVGQDGHVIEGDYTFNASPDYAEAVPVTTSVLEEKSSLNVAALAVIGAIAIMAIGVLVKRKGEKK